MSWKCNKCNWTGDKPIICPGLSGGVVVNIIDILCPSCTGGEPRLQGTEEEKDKWWNNWYSKMEGKQ